MHRRRRQKGRRVAIRKKVSEDSQLTDVFLSKVSSILVLPVETILRILEYSGPLTVTTVMRTSKALHIIASRALYTTVDVANLSARMFFTTIASRTTLSKFYAPFVKRLTFSATEFFDKFMTFAIFCETLLCLQCLRTLSISIFPGDGEWMRMCLKRFGIVRERISTLAVARIEGERSLFTRLTLPIMHTLKIGGDLALIDIVTLRHLSQLDITTPLGYDEVDSMLTAIASGPTRTSLKTFSLRLLPNEDTRTILMAIAESLEGLHTLSIEQPSVNALDVLHSITSSKTIFPRLRNFLVNRFAVQTPCDFLKTLTRKEFDTIVIQALQRVTDTSFALSFLCFGGLRWYRFYDHRLWTSSEDEDSKRWWEGGLGRVRKIELQRDIRSIRSGLNGPLPLEWKSI